MVDDKEMLAELKKINVNLNLGLFFLVVVAMLLGVLIATSTQTHAASVPRLEKVGDFTCNIIVDENPVKEIDGVAVVKFGAEYSILVKNNNNRRAAAHITIDGSPISTFGALVINANSEVTLERYLTDSLDKGRKFKFVPLDDPQVDDPGRSENGLIRVEFQLEEKQEYVEWNYNPNLLYSTGADDHSTITDGSVSQLDRVESKINELLIDTNTVSTSINTFNIYTTTSGMDCVPTSAESGATIAGGRSDQKFHKINIDLDPEKWAVEIRLKGVRDSKITEIGRVLPGETIGAFFTAPNLAEMNILVDKWIDGLKKEPGEDILTIDITCFCDPVEFLMGVRDRVKYSVSYRSKQDIPRHDVPCPCGPNYWFIKYEIKGE